MTHQHTVTCDVCGKTEAVTEWLRITGTGPIATPDICSWKCLAAYATERIHGGFYGSASTP